MNTLVIISYIVLALLCIWAVWWIWNPKVLTRAKVLKKARKILISDQGCICVSVQEALRGYGFKGMASSEILEIFPPLTFETAKEKGFNPSEEFKPYWWDRKNMKDRIAFLDWLIDQYRDASSNLYVEFEKYYIR